MIVGIYNYYVTFLFSAIYINKKINHILCYNFTWNQGPWKITSLVILPLYHFLTSKVPVRGSKSDYFHTPSYIIHNQYKCDKLWQ